MLGVDMSTVGFLSMFCDSALIVLQNALAACNLLASRRRIEVPVEKFCPRIMV